MGIGDRLKEERERLGLNQTDFAALAGASKNTQYNYEKGERSPDSNYLAAAAAQGLDVLYVITGARTPQPSASFSAEEMEFVQLLRCMDESDRAILSRTAQAFAKPPGR
ncbi:TPA: helix-turn-helix transcriptional regulator [Pseudomonas putida]|uniref:helix-turn-helix domain-containing protein n=1 Tax=Pseudomonas putida TaxID=303 RepID=UPI002364999D|nr:helix-turn-helix transcriptional regulator [Pseudomonas putida]MDD2009912.1 helix-turn-helix domain-containing protein [Pseudomonas putida]HDS1776253.1 helix-turn-helix transcriptional regulator [Pseudomonas putida]